MNFFIPPYVENKIKQERKIKMLFIGNIAMMWREEQT